MSTHMLVVKRTEALLNIDFRKCSTNIILLLKTSLIEYNIGSGSMGMSHGYGPAADKKEMIDLMREAVERDCP